MKNSLFLTIGFRILIHEYTIVEGLMRAITRCWRCVIINAIYFNMITDVSANL